MTKAAQTSGGMARVRWLAAFLVLLFAIPMTSQAEILEAELQVNGLSCPFCAFGIEKKLRRVEGVQEVDVLLDEGRVRLTFHPSNPATVGALEEAVTKSGFEVSGVKLKVQGTLAAEDSDPMLDAGGERFWLLQSDNGRMRPLSSEALETLRRGSGSGLVLVNGTVHTHVDGPSGLLVTGGQASAGGAP